MANFPVTYALLALALANYLPAVVCQGGEFIDETPRKCEPITLPLCQGIGYNYTAMPNDFNHLRQEDAGLEAHQFYPLVQVKCSPLLQFYLCSMYVPICLPNYPRPLKPCRSVCERSRAGCEPLMAKYGFVWPPQLACNDLPESPTHDGGEAAEDDELCMEPPKQKTHQPDRVRGGGVEDNMGAGHAPYDDNFDIDHIEHTNVVAPAVPQSPYDRNGDMPPKANIYPSVYDHCRCDCFEPFHKLAGLDAKAAARFRVGNVTGCAYPCLSPYLRNNKDRQQFLTTWIGIWSISCFAITLLTFVTFLIDMDRFQYPERPIFFLSFCYMMVSVGYIIRLIKGHRELACVGELLQSQSLDPPLCTIVFLLIYFFGMASSAWWVVISFNWFLAAGLKWSHEGMSQYSQVFHALAWTLPSVQTLIVLIASAVDGDPLAGVCYVGNTDLTMLRWLVLVPLAIYGAFGVVFLLAGFISLLKVRHWIKTQTGEKTEKLEHLMVKIGTFAFLYIIPAACVVGALLYEQDYRSRWELAMTCPCAAGGVAGGGDSLHTQAEEPMFVLALIKYSMSLVVGVTSGLWIWSRKTLLAWRRVALVVVSCGGQGREAKTSQGVVYQPAAAIFAVKSHTDVSSSLTTSPPRGGACGAQLLIDGGGEDGTYSGATGSYRHTIGYPRQHNMNHV